MHVRQGRAAILTALGLGATIGVLVTMGWSAALVIGVFVAAVAVVRYGLVGADTFAGAFLAGRPDELHGRLRLQIRARVAVVALLVAVAAAAVERARGDVAWPFELVAAIGVASFVAGLVVYGAGGGAADIGDALGPRADERQVELRLHALQLSAIVMTLATTIGLLALTGRSTDRPFEILEVVLGGSFVAGIVLHGSEPPRRDLRRGRGSHRRGGTVRLE